VIDRLPRRGNRSRESRAKDDVVEPVLQELHQLGPGGAPLLLLASSIRRRSWRSLTP